MHDAVGPQGSLTVLVLTPPGQRRSTATIIWELRGTADVARLEAQWDSDRSQEARKVSVKALFGDTPRRVSVQVEEELLVAYFSIEFNMKALDSFCFPYQSIPYLEVLDCGDLWTFLATVGR